MFSASAPVLYLPVNSGADFAQRLLHRSEDLCHQEVQDIQRQAPVRALRDLPILGQVVWKRIAYPCTLGTRWKHKLGQLFRESPRRNSL
jgi:hypothetical protein